MRSIFWHHIFSPLEKSQVVVKLTYKQNGNNLFCLLECKISLNRNNIHLNYEDTFQITGPLRASDQLHPETRHFHFCAPPPPRLTFLNTLLILRWTLVIVFSAPSLAKRTVETRGLFHPLPRFEQTFHTLSKTSQSRQTILCLLPSRTLMSDYN